MSGRKSWYGNISTNHWTLNPYGRTSWREGTCGTRCRSCSRSSSLPSSTTACPAPPWCPRTPRRGTRTWRRRASSPTTPRPATASPRPRPSRRATSPGSSRASWGKVRRLLYGWPLCRLHWKCVYWFNLCNKTENLGIWESSANINSLTFSTKLN